MPNHVRNALTVVGPARDVATFVLRSQVAKPPTGDPPGSWNYSAEERADRVPFDLQGVVPLPALYSQVPYDNGRQGPSGYDMEVDTWGVKWGAYSIDPATDIQLTEHRATYRFTTAWNPPDTYYAQASLAFPHCTFFVSWGGEGPSLGRAVYRRGEQLETDAVEMIDCPAPPGRLGR